MVLYVELRVFTKKIFLIFPTFYSSYRIILASSFSLLMDDMTINTKNTHLYLELYFSFDQVLKIK